MASIETTRPAALNTNIGARLTAAFSVFATWNDLRATRKSLGKLSNHQLNDIGLSRGDVDLITR